MHQFHQLQKSVRLPTRRAAITVRVRATPGPEERFRKLWDEKQKRALVQGEKIFGILKEIDQIARDDVDSLKKNCKHAHTRTGTHEEPKEKPEAKPVEVVEPEFFRDPERTHTALRADSDAGNHN